MTAPVGVVVTTPIHCSGDSTRTLHPYSLAWITILAMSVLQHWLPVGLQPCVLKIPQTRSPVLEWVMEVKLNV